MPSAHDEQVQPVGSGSAATARRLALYRNVRPLHFAAGSDRDAALAAGAEQAPAYPLLSGAIRLGCRLAIRLSERI